MVIEITCSETSVSHEEYYPGADAEQEAYLEWFSKLHELYEDAIDMEDDPSRKRTLESLLEGLREDNK